MTDVFVALVYCPRIGDSSVIAVATTMDKAKGLAEAWAMEFSGETVTWEGDHEHCQAALTDCTLFINQMELY